MHSQRLTVSSSIPTLLTSAPASCNDSERNRASSSSHHSAAPRGNFIPAGTTKFPRHPTRNSTTLRLPRREAKEGKRLRGRERWCGAFVRLCCSRSERCRPRIVPSRRRNCTHCRSIRHCAAQRRRENPPCPAPPRRAISLARDSKQTSPNAAG